MLYRLLLLHDLSILSDWHYQCSSGLAYWPYCHFPMTSHFGSWKAMSCCCDPGHNVLSTFIHVSLTACLVIIRIRFVLSPWYHKCNHWEWKPGRALHQRSRFILSTKYLINQPYSNLFCQFRTSNTWFMYSLLSVRVLVSNKVTKQVL